MLEWLKRILGDAYTPEVDKQVSDEIGRGFVARGDFNTVNTENGQLKDAVKDRDGQIASLQNSTGDADALKATIAQLQADNKAKDDAHTAEMQALKVDAAVERALAAAKVHNPLTVKPLLQMEGAELQEDGTIKGLDAQLKKLAEAEDTKFLFKQEESGVAKAWGVTPASKKDGLPGVPATPASLEDAVRMQLNTTKQ